MYIESFKRCKAKNHDLLKWLVFQFAKLDVEKKIRFFMNEKESRTSSLIREHRYDTIKSSSRILLEQFRTCSITSRSNDQSIKTWRNHALINRIDLRFSIFTRNENSLRILCETFFASSIRRDRKKNEWFSNIDYVSRMHFVITHS